MTRGRRPAADTHSGDGKPAERPAGEPRPGISLEPRETEGGEQQDERIRAAAALLREHGIPAAEVSAAGPKEEIAAIQAPVSALERIRELAPRVKALGFEYVALELADAPTER